MAAEPTAKQQRGRPFEPGKSGNPGGRLKGSRNRALAALQSLMDGQGEAVTQKAVALALAGDPTALRLVLDRIFPASRERAIVLDLPKRYQPKRAAEAIIQAVVQGELTPGEGRGLMDLIEAKARLVDLEAMKAELAELREMLEQWRAGREGHQR